MTERTGQLPNPPLFYVLASIRFQPWLSLPTKIAEIQESLRDQFPLINEVSFEQGISIPQSAGAGPPTEHTIARQQAWSFMSADRTCGCQISLNQIIVHTLEYSTFERFGEIFKSVAGAVERQARHFDVNAMGIRYLDRISPAPGEALTQYLATGFLPQPLDSAEFQTQGGMSQTDYATKSGVLQARFWTGNGYAALPHDLIPLYFLTKDLAGGSPTLERLEPGHGTLDSDSIWSSSTPARMGAAEALEKLRELHIHANAFFRSACSQYAFQVWGKKS